jgi:tellurite resistance protein
MELRIFAPQELPAVMTALRQVAVANDRFTEAEAALIDGVARIHGAVLTADDLTAPLSFDELARVVSDPHSRKRLVQLAIVTALVEGTPSPETEAVVRDLASALSLDEEGLRVLHGVTHGHLLMARIDMFRRFTRFLRNTKEFPGVLRFAMPVLGVGGGDQTLAARYRELETCAPGTLGRAFYQHFIDNGFKFPGEVGGLPMPFHDLGHVLAGYSSFTWDCASPRWRKATAATSTFRGCSMPCTAALAARST